MILFLLVYFPFILVLYSISHRQKKILPYVFIGGIEAVILCAVKSFYFLSHRVIQYSFLDNFIYSITRETLLPVFIVLLIFYIFDKEDFAVKVESVFPLLFSFYAVYLPYCVINSNATSSYSLYSSLVKPVVFSAMLFQIYLSLKCIAANKKNKGIVCANVFIILIYLIFPSVIEVLVELDEFVLLQILFSILYCAITICWGSFNYLKGMLKK